MKGQEQKTTQKCEQKGEPQKQWYLEGRQGGGFLDGGKNNPKGDTINVKGMGRRKTGKLQ